MKAIKRALTVAFALVFAALSSLTAWAADGEVRYDGNAGEFIFSPGSEYSPTDLFPNFKDVMPGDSISQKITVRNDVENDVKVEIYIRALGAQEGSEEFLSKLNLRVEKLTDTELFNAAASESAQLTEWTYLGLLYSGGEAELNVVLDVPTSLDNSSADQIGYLDWEFMVNELPVEPDDPKPPQTGDNSNVVLWIICTIALVALIFFILLWRRRDQDEDEQESNQAKR